MSRGVRPEVFQFEEASGLMAVWVEVETRSQVWDQVTSG